MPLTYGMGLAKKRGEFLSRTGFNFKGIGSQYLECKVRDLDLISDHKESPNLCFLRTVLLLGRRLDDPAALS